MSLKNGIVTYFNGEYGEIKKDNEKYIFLGHEIMGDINVGNFVSFRSEEIHGVKRAYFVTSLDKKELVVEHKEKMKELL